MKSGEKSGRLMPSVRSGTNIKLRFLLCDCSGALVLLYLLLSISILITCIKIGIGENMSASLRHLLGRMVGVWPLVVDGVAFVWVEEVDHDVEYAILYHRIRGLWYVAEAYVLQDVLAVELMVQPVHGVM